MRRYLIILVILILALIFYIFIMRTGPEPAPSGNQLTAALAGTEATLKEAVLEARTEVPAGELAGEGAARELAELARDLLLVPAATVAGGQPCLLSEARGAAGSAASVAAYVLRDDTAGLELSFKRSSMDEAGYLYVKATLTEPERLPALEQHWQAVFAGRGYRPRYATLVVGTLRGLPTYDEQERILADLLEGLAVERLWQQRDAGWVSGGGYSPLLPAPLIDARGERINVQAALSFRPAEECTYLYLGSPLIYREF